MSLIIFGYNNEWITSLVTKSIFYSDFESKRQLFWMSRICDENDILKVQNLKSFWDSSKIYFVSALSSSLHSLNLSGGLETKKELPSPRILYTQITATLIEIETSSSISATSKIP